MAPHTLNKRQRTTRDFPDRGGNPAKSFRWGKIWGSEYRYMGPGNPMNQGSRFRGPGANYLWHDETYGGIHKRGGDPYLGANWSDMVSAKRAAHNWAKHPLQNWPDLVGVGGLTVKRGLNTFTSDRVYTASDYRHHRRKPTGHRTIRGVVKHYGGRAKRVADKYLDFQTGLMHKYGPKWTKYIKRHWW